MRSDETLRVVRGTVDAGAAAPTGTGFTVTRTGTGTYTARFTVPFRFPPTVIAVPAVNSALAMSVTSVTTDQFSVIMYMIVSQAMGDQPWTFVATGRP